MTAVKAKAGGEKEPSRKKARFLPKASPTSPRERSANSPEEFAYDASGAALTPDLGWKRVLDLAFICASLPVTLPVMIFIVFWIRLVSRGPALFRQERIGKDGKPFVLYKFRSMRMNCGTSRHETYLRHLVKTDSPMIKLDLLCDSRVIPGGCLLRAAGLDELPQLLNVLKGEMSLVGPRPCLPYEYGYFSEQQRQRFAVLPGLTGSWQVCGKNQSTFSEMNSMDVRYAKEASPALDLAIILRTPAALIRQMWQAFQQDRAVRRHINFDQSTHKPGSNCSTQRLG